MINMPNNAQENNRLECSCIGAKNKESLESALISKRNYDEATLAGLENRLNTIYGFEIDESYPADFKKEQIKRTNNQINDTNDEIIHNKMLFDVVSNIKICGD